MVKYEFSYNDTEGVLHECTISDEDYIYAPFGISGNVLLSYATVDDPLESIRGSGLTINLDASTSRDFSDLYSEGDKSFKVQYKRDSVILFNGWLSSEGIYEDWVSDKWVISLECVDGLGFLPDLAYVDSSGLQYAGKQSLLEIIANCLDRTGVSQNINTNIDIYYTGLSTSLDVLDNVYYNADRFVKDDNNTIMSCDEVLRDVLRPFGASITSFNGEWYVYKLNQLALDDTLTFFRYDNTGIALSPTTKTDDLGFSLGSQIDGYYPHHANGNQSISNKKSIGAYRISYKYGLVKSLLENILLEHNGVTISDWTVNSTTNITLDASGFGVDFDFVGTPPVKNLTSDLVNLVADDLITFTLRYKTISLTKNTTILWWGQFNYKIILTGGSTYYYNPFAVPANWTLTDTTCFGYGGELNTLKTITTELPALPISGDLTIEIWSATKTNDEVGEFLLQEVSLSPTDDSDNGIIGEFHTLERGSKPSANIKETEVVNNGDNPSDVYYGTIYKADETTPTDTWFRKGKTEAIPILKMMGEETLRLNAQTSRVFSGDVYGYIPFLTLIEIINIDNNFSVVEYSYDTYSNITTVKVRQIFGDELADIDYEMTYDYGKTVKPTIKG